MTDILKDATEDFAQSHSTPSSTQRRSTKSDQLQKLLVRSRGATVKQIAAQFSWQPHTIRAAVSRLRTAGNDITLDRSGKTARYRINQEPSQ